MPGEGSGGTRCFATPLLVRSRRFGWQISFIYIVPGPPWIAFATCGARSVINVLCANVTKLSVLSCLVCVLFTLYSLFVTFSGGTFLKCCTKETMKLQPGSHKPPTYKESSVAPDNVQRSIPVGPQRICNGLLMYSNWREMQIEFAQFSTILFINMDHIMLSWSNTDPQCISNCFLSLFSIPFDPYTHDRISLCNI